MVTVKGQFQKFFTSLQLSEKMAEIAACSDVMRAANSQKLNDLSSMSPKSNTASVLEAMMELSEEDILQFWTEAVPELTKITREALTGMRATAETRSTRNKFGDFTLGPLEVFYKGMDGMIGLPALKIEKAMEEEHDSDELFFAYNQGLTIETSPKQQWKKVLPRGFDNEINNEDYDGKKLCEDFMKHPRAVQASLEKAELVALRLYTGPMYKRYNEKLREAGRLIMKFLEEQRNNGEEKDMDAAMAQARLEIGEDYVTTLHTLISALIKLSQCTKHNDATRKKAYRGIHDLSPPACFLNETPGGGRGGVEFGFLSTTTDLNTAVTYASAGERPMIFELDFGMVDHGADIGWISFFPGENEVLLPPLCMLEVDGKERYERTTASDGSEGGAWVSVWPLKLNLNLQCLTLKQLRERRKTLHLSMTRNLIAEVERDLQDEVEGEEEESEELHVRESARKVVLKQCEDVLYRHQERQANWFNDEDNYKQAMDESMMVKRFSMQRFLSLCRHAPRSFHSEPEKERRQKLYDQIQAKELSTLQHDAWKYAESSGKIEWHFKFRGQDKQLWELLCSRDEIPKLEITPTDVDDHVLQVLVECMAAYPTGLREIQFGSFRIKLSRDQRRSFLDLGFGGDGATRKKLEVTHVPKFGNDEARLVAALLAALPHVEELNLSFCDMPTLDPILQKELMGSGRRGGPRALTSLRIAHCGLLESALCFVAEYIQANPALTQLDIAGNVVSTDTCHAIGQALAARTGSFTIDKLTLPFDHDNWSLPELHNFGPKGVRLLAAIIERNTKLVSLNDLTPPAVGSTWDLRKALGFDSSDTTNTGGGWASIEIPLAFVGNQPLETLSKIPLDSTELEWPTGLGEEQREQYKDVLRKAMQEWAVSDAAEYFAMDKAKLSSVEFKDREYGPLLLETARLGSQEGVRKLYCAVGKEHDGKYQDAMGRTALSWAAHCSSPWFLKTGFQVSKSSALAQKLRAPQVRDRTGRVIYDPNTTSPRDRDEDFRQTIVLLLNNGNDARVVRGQPSALLIAAANGHDKVVDLLLEVPHDIDNNTEATDAEALVLAAAAGHDVTVERLLAYGANVNQRHRSTFQLPLARSEPDLFNTITIIDEVKEVYKKPTALIMAAATNRVDIVKMLLENKADASIHCAITTTEGSAKDSKGVWTPLLIAASKGHGDIVHTLLLSAQAMEPAHVHDAMEHAAGKGHSKIVDMLIEAGADPDSRPWWWVAMEACGLKGRYL